MKKNPKDGGRYQRSVKAAKLAAKKIERAAEEKFQLPRGSMRVCLTKMSPARRDRLANTS